MFGTGLPEIVIILLVILLLFGPAVVTFWLGYVMGQNRSAGAQAAPDARGTESPADDERELDDE